MGPKSLEERSRSRISASNRVVFSMSILARSVCGLAIVILVGVQVLCAQTQPEPNGEPITAGQITSPSSPPPDEHRTGKSLEDYDPLLDPPPLPHSTITLVGGTLTSVDEIQNRITVKPFGGKQRLHMNFDVRTHIFRNGVATAERDLKLGDRVYLDTMLDGSRVFAKSIWIRSAAGSGNGRGQILRYDPRANTLTLRDEVSADPVSFHLDSGTVIRSGNSTGSVADLKSGSLVAVTFDPQQGRSGVVREISILAEPGSVFTFMGRITFIDLSQKLIAIANQRDDKDYDIYFDSIPATVLQGLREGSQASIAAIFDGSRYVAQKVDIIPGNPAGQEQK